MRAYECECGQHLEAADDEELLNKVREHVNQVHPDMNLKDEQLHAMIADGAYNK